MSEYTETVLDLIEMELAGILVKVIRPDGQEDLVPNPNLSQADLDARLEEYLGEYDENAPDPDEDISWWN